MWQVATVFAWCRNGPVGEVGFVPHVDWGVNYPSAFFKLWITLRLFPDVNETLIEQE